MDSAIKSMAVDFFERTGFLVTVFPNDLYDFKIKTQVMSIVLFTDLKVDENSE